MREGKFVSKVDKIALAITGIPAAIIILVGFLIMYREVNESVYQDFKIQAPVQMVSDNPDRFYFLIPTTAGMCRVTPNSYIAYDTILGLKTGDIIKAEMKQTHYKLLLGPHKPYTIIPLTTLDLKK